MIQEFRADQEMHVIRIVAFNARGVTETKRLGRVWVSIEASKSEQNQVAARHGGDYLERITQSE